jgi:hypothetical protein
MTSLFNNSKDNTAETHTININMPCAMRMIWMLWVFSVSMPLTNSSMVAM